MIAMVGRFIAFFGFGAAVCLTGCERQPAEPAAVEVTAPSPPEAAERLPTEPNVQLSDAELEFKFFADPRPDEDSLPAEEAARLTAEHSDDIHEAVLREQLSDRENVEGTVFVSFGADEEGKPIEPSPEFFERLKDLPYKIRSASLARYPEFGELTGPNTLRCVEDPETGERSWVYTSKILRWFEGQEVEVDVEQYISPLGAGGYIQVMRLHDGKWIEIEADALVMRRGLAGSKRFDSVCLIAVTLVGCWLGMQAVHEAGHVLGAWATGAQVERVVLHPLTISRTDVSDNRQPQFVAWMGPVFGVAAPVAIWLVAMLARMPGAFVLRFFAGFCLIANGGYLAFGALQRIGDCGTLLTHGAPIWSLFLFGAIAMPLGLALWNGTGAAFGLGPHSLPIDRRVAIGTALVAVALLILGIALPA